MGSLFNMPPLGMGFNVNRNGLLGQGDLTRNDRLGGTNSGLQRALTQLSGGTDVINALQQTLSANPQASMVLTGTTGNTVQAPGTIGVGNLKLADAASLNPILAQKLALAGKM